MVNIIINEGAAELESFLQTAVEELTHFNFEASLSSFLDQANLDTLTPTALGASLIQVADISGRILRFEGSGFGPIVVNGDLDTALNDFLDAVKALDGSASGTLSRVIIKDGTTELLRVTVTESKWTIRSGTEVLTIKGSLPTNIDDVTLAIDQLFDLTTGQIDPNFNAGTSILAGYTISEISTTENGVKQVAMQFSANQVEMSYGDYALVLDGAFPDSFASVIDLAIALADGELPPAYQLDGVELTNTATGDVIVQGVGSVNLSEIETLGDDNDTLEVTGLDAYDYLPDSVALGAGNDVVVLNVELPAMTNENFDFLAYNSAKLLHVDGGLGRDTVDYSATGFGVVVTMGGIGASSYGNIRSNVVGSEVEWSAFTGVENVTGTNFNDIISGNSGTNLLQGGLGKDSLFGFGGNDTMDGGAGNDSLDGGDGDDVIKGGAGNDKMLGGDGLNTLTGGTGNDTLTSGRHADVFRYDSLDFDKDRILKWQDGLDKIDLVGAGFDFADFSLSQVGTSAVLTLIADPTNTITFVGKNMALIDATDFI